MDEAVPYNDGVPETLARQWLASLSSTADRRGVHSPPGHELEHAQKARGGKEGVTPLAAGELPLT